MPIHHVSFLSNGCVLVTCQKVKLLSPSGVKSIESDLVIRWVGRAFTAQSNAHPTSPHTSVARCFHAITSDQAQPTMMHACASRGEWRRSGPSRFAQWNCMEICHIIDVTNTDVQLCTRVESILDLRSNRSAKGRIENTKGSRHKVDKINSYCLQR